jgi:cobalt-zinc-cadmium efflux system outer membrane protein
MRIRILLVSIVGLFLSTSSFAQNNYNLQKALKTASDNNPILKTQKFDIAVAESEIVSAKIIPNIKLNNQSLFLMNGAMANNASNLVSARNSQIWWQATKVFQIAGQRKNKIEVANKSVAYTKQNFEEIKRNLYQAVALKWLDVWTAKKQFDILNRAKNNLDSVVTINKNRLKNQVITQIDYNRTELLANQYALQIKSAGQTLKNETANFKYLLGTSEDITIDENDSFEYVTTTTSDDLLKTSLESRTDVLAAKSAIEVANSNIKLQKSLAYPQPELGMIFNPQNTLPYFGLYATIELPFFDRNQGEIQKSGVLKSQAEQDLIAKQQQIQTELTTAYNAYLLQKKNVADFEAMLKQSDAILAGVKYTYLRGGTTIIDFLEAQRSWLDTQQQYYNALQQYRESYIALLYQSGLINTISK